MEGKDFLQEGERVELDIRRYRGALVLLLFVWMVPAGLILLGFYFAAKYAASLGPAVMYLDMALIAMLMLDFLIAYAWIVIYNRYRLILTNKRIVIVTQFGISSHHVSQCHLEFIQDVSTHHPHFIADLLNYGDVSIETSGKDEQFIFPTCYQPHLVASKIVQLCRASETPVEAPQEEPRQLPAETSADSAILNPAGPVAPPANVFYEMMPDLPFEIPDQPQKDGQPNKNAVE